MSRVARSYSDQESLAGLQASEVLERSGQTKWPIDVERVAETVGIKTHYEKLDDDMSGALVVKNGKAVAVINNEHHENRQRFTLAHEIGHYLLHHLSSNGGEADAVYVDTYLRSRTSSLGIDQKEIEANKYAADLLMPERMIKEAISNKKFQSAGDYLVVRLMAKSFNVSEQAMTYRLVSLGIMSEV